MTANIFLQIRDKERLTRNLIRTNHRIIRTFVCQDEVQFVKVWEAQSATSFLYDSNRLYCDNYRKCLAGYGYGGKPSLLYKLPKCAASQKTEDALVCQYHTEEVSDETRPHLIVLTKDNWIVRSALNTGQVLQQIYLHSRLNYHYLGWNEAGSSFVVKTTMKKSSSLMREADVECNVLLTMAVFTVCPLQLKACMEVDRRIFGNDLTGAQLIGANIFFTTHHRGVVRFYSFERMLAEHTVHRVGLGDDFPNGQAGDCKIGQAPHGVPVTLQLTERPAILLEVQCHDNDVQFGGFPWHYLASPKSPQDPTHIKVYNLATHEEATNGSLESDRLALGMPGAIFHLDGTERIINTKMRSMSVLKVHQRDDGRCEVIEDHVIEPSPRTMHNHLERTRQHFSQRGRPLKVHASFGELGDNCHFDPFITQMLDNFCCENDLDLMVVSMPNKDMDADTLHGHVTLHDNGSGRLLKSIPLPDVWDDTMEHSVVMDLDTLVHTAKTASGKWVCKLFRAVRESAWKEMSTRSVRGTGKRKQRSGRRRRRVPRMSTNNS